MDFKQVQLVRTSFQAVQPQVDGLAADFYTRLFSYDPTLRSLFDDDLHEQERKFMTMLGLIIDYLDQPFKLYAILARLGDQHRRYGVLPAYYATIGRALIATMASAQSAGWTPDMEAAWLAVYSWVAGEMQAGAAGSD